MKTCPLASDYRVLIRALQVEKEWGALRMMNEFPSRQWKLSTLNDLIKTLTERGSGRPQSVYTSDNIAIVFDIICRQEGQPGSSKSPREISLETGILRRSVQHIVKHVLLEKCTTWTTKVNSPLYSAPPSTCMTLFLHIKQWCVLKLQVEVLGYS